MNVGIIVYSQSGNTLSVAKKLGQSLIAAGHAVAVEKVESLDNNQRSSAPVELKTAPDVCQYDAIIFASPVQGFALAPVMKLYLSQISSLADKKVYCFVTQQLKKAWLGGNRAVRQITTACQAKGADIKSSGVVNWSCGTREKQIEDIVCRLSTLNI